MNGPRILLVEDNPLTRGAVVEFLRAGGFRVDEAPDGGTAVRMARENRPALVLQDMGLPDMDGLALLPLLRAAAPGVPILALTGMPGELRRAEGDATFDDVLAKPVSPSALLLTVRAHIDMASETRGDVAAGDLRSGRRRILVAAPREFLEVVTGGLGHAGFEVVLAEDVAEALEASRSMKPEAVAAFAVLAGGDGFTLVRDIRRLEGMESVPSVLIADEFEGEEARAVAMLHGAVDLVPRPRGVDELEVVVRRALAAAPVPPLRDGGPALDARREACIRAALVRVTETAGDLGRRISLQSAALSLLGLLGESLSTPDATRRGPAEFLQRCLAAAGTSRGIAYLRRLDGGVDFAAHVGFGDAVARDLRDAPWIADLVAEVMASREPLAFPGPRANPATTERILEALGGRSVLVAPLVAAGDSLGALVMVSSRFDLLEWKDIARAVALQIGQAVALSRAVAELARNEARFRSLFEDAVIGMVRADPDGRLLEANRAFATLLGHGSPEELRTFSPDIPWKRPSDRQRLAEAARAGPRFDGIELDLVRRDGATVRVRLAGRVIAGASGQPAGIEALVEDVTVRRAAEEEIRRSQRLEALRGLAGGIAGDFNNVLTAMAARAELIERALPDAPDVQAQASELQAEIARAGALVAELSLFARPGSSDPRPVDIGVLLEAALPAVGRVLGAGTPIELRRSPTPLLVLADAGQVEHALLAVAHHARILAGEGGAIVLETSAALLDADFAGGHAGIQPGSYAVLAARVRPGRPHATSSSGTTVDGLGLAAVEGFARQAGGTFLEQEAADGSRVLRVYLPRIAEPAPVVSPPAPVVAAAVAAPARGAVILLAEDEAPVRMLMAETLRLDGYDVREAADGAAALDVLDAIDGPVHLLVADVVMPGIGGRELAIRVRDRRPGTPVLFVSGYLDATSPDDPTANDPFLPKPFTPRVLAARVRELLAGPLPAPPVAS